MLPFIIADGVILVVVVVLFVMAGKRSSKVQPVENRDAGTNVDENAAFL